MQRRELAAWGCAWRHRSHLRDVDLVCLSLVYSTATALIQKMRISPRGADAHGDRDAGVLGVYVRMFGINESDGML